MPNSKVKSWLVSNGELVEWILCPPPVKSRNFSLQEKLTQREKYDATQIYKIMRPSVVFIVSQ